MPDRKPLRRVRRLHVGQLGVFVVLLLAGFWLHRRGQPEALREWQGGKIAGARVYTAGVAFVANRARTREVRSESVRGGDVRLLATEPAEMTAPQTDESNDLTIRGPYVYFTREVSGAPIRASAADSASEGSTVDGSKWTGAPSGPDARRVNYPSRSSILMRVPIRGGPPQKVAVVGAVVDITDDTVYWLDAHVYYIVHRAKSLNGDGMLRGNYRLMATSMSNGATRVLVADLPINSGIQKWDDGFAWTAAHSGVSGMKRVCFLRAGSADPVTARDVPYDPPALANLYEGRVYWVEKRPTSPMPPIAATSGSIMSSDTPPGAAASKSITGIGTTVGPAVADLVSTKLDGSDRRVAYSAVIELVKVYHRRLYLVVAKGDPKSLSKHLVRLRPERGNSAETVAALPREAGAFQFDEDYAYFETNREEHRRFVDWLLADPDRVERVRRLYRIRLPD